MGKIRVYKLHLYIVHWGDKKKIVIKKKKRCRRIYPILYRLSSYIPDTKSHPNILDFRCIDWIPINIGLEDGCDSIYILENQYELYEKLY